MNPRLVRAALEQGLKDLDGLLDLSADDIAKALDESEKAHDTEAPFKFPIRISIVLSDGEVETKIGWSVKKSAKITSGIGATPDMLKEAGATP